MHLRHASPPEAAAWLRRSRRERLRLSPWSRRPGPQAHDGDGLDELDLAAGDGDLLFMTAGRPRVNGAAFDLDAVAGLGPLGWRPRDFIGAYVELAAVVRGQQLLPDVARVLTVWDPALVRLAAQCEIATLYDPDPAARLSSYWRAREIWLSAAWHSAEGRALPREVAGVLGHALSPERFYALRDATAVAQSVGMQWGAAGEMVTRASVPLALAVAVREATKGPWRALR